MATREFSPEEIKDIRDALGLEQVEFAEKLGVSQATVSHWETGRRHPSGSAKMLLEQISARLLRKNSR